MTDTTIIQSLVNKVVQVNGLDGLTNCASSVDTESLLTTLTGKNSSQLIDDLKQAGVSSTKISEFESVLSRIKCYLSLVSI